VDGRIFPGRSAAIDPRVGGARTRGSELAVGVGNRLAPDSFFNQNQEWPAGQLEFAIPGRAPVKTGLMGPTGIATDK